MVRMKTKGHSTASGTDLREHIRTGAGADTIADALIDHLHYIQAKLPQHASRNDWYQALAYTIRDRMLDHYITTVDTISGANPTAKVVAYLSAEFLTGPHLGNGLINLGLWKAAEDAVAFAYAVAAALRESAGNDADEPLAAAGQELKGKLVMINYSGNSRASPRVTWTMNQLFESPRLVLLTRRGSNFYHQAQGKYAVCLLGDPAQAGKKADERVLPSGDDAGLAA